MPRRPSAGPTLPARLLDLANLRDTDFTGARLDGACMAIAPHLMQHQIDAALGNAQTVLPPGLMMPDQWRGPNASSVVQDVFGYHLLEDEPPADPYSLLDVAPTAKSEEIRAAYIRLAKRYHPDLNPYDANAEDRFKRVNEAYRQAVVAKKRAANAPRRNRMASPWFAAIIIFLLAFGAPSIAVYWFRLPPGLLSQAPGAEQASPKAPPAPQRIDLKQTGALITPVSERVVILTGSTQAAPVLAHAMVVGHGPAARTRENFSDRLETAGFLQPRIAATDHLERPPTPALAKTRDDAPAVTGSIETSGARPAGAQLEQQQHQAMALAQQPEAPASPAIEAAPQRLAALEPPSAISAAADSVAATSRDALRDAPEPDAPAAVIESETEAALTADDAPPRPERAERRPDVRAPAPRTIPEAAAANEQTGRPAAARRLATLVEQENPEADLEAWVSAKEAGTIAAFRAYLVSYPTGRYADNAQERLSALEAEISDRKKEEAVWARALQKKTRAAYAAYLRAHPHGRYASDAKKQLAALKAKVAALKKDEDAWSTAKRKNSRDAYLGYVKSFPNGRYAALAKDALERAVVKSASAETAGPASTAAAAALGPEAGAPRSDRPNRTMYWPSSDEPFIEILPRR